MKKFITLLLVLAMALALAGCGSTEQAAQTTAEPEATNEPVTSISYSEEWGSYDLGGNFYPAKDLDYENEYMVFALKAEDESHYILGFDWENEDGYTPLEYATLEAEYYGIYTVATGIEDGDEVAYYVCLVDVNGTKYYSWNYVSAYGNHLVETSFSYPAEEMQVADTNVYYYLPTTAKIAAYEPTEEDKADAMVYGWYITDSAYDADFCDGLVYAWDTEATTMEDILAGYTEYYGHEPEKSEVIEVNGIEMLVSYETDEWEGKTYPTYNHNFVKDGKAYSFYLYGDEVGESFPYSIEAVINSIHTK